MWPGGSREERQEGQGLFLPACRCAGGLCGLEMPGRGQARARVGTAMAGSPGRTE